MPFFWGDAQKHNAQIFELTFLDWYTILVRIPFVLPFSHYRQTRDEIVQVWSLLRITLILSFNCGSCKLS